MIIVLVVLVVINDNMTSTCSKHIQHYYMYIFSLVFAVILTYNVSMFN